MIKTLLYLLLTLKFSAEVSSYQENVSTTSTESNQDYEGESSEEFSYYTEEEEVDRNGVASGIIDLFGRLFFWDDRNMVFLIGDGSLVPNEQMYHFDVDEISSITAAVYNVYEQGELDENGLKYIDMKALADLSNQIHLFTQTDHLLMWKCLKSMVPIIDTAQYATIVKNLLSSSDAEIALSQILESIFTNHHTFSTNFVFANSDLVFLAWHPFQNISGVAVYEDSDGENSNWIRIIYRNQTSDNVDLDKLKIAGYIPTKFMEKQFLDDENQVIVMIIILNGNKYNQVLEVHEGIENYIGIGVPAGCKKNYEPILKAFFRSETDDGGDKWIEFGQEYFDSLDGYDWYTCALSKMSYFGKFPPDYEQTKGAKIIKPCLRYKKKQTNPFFPTGDDIYELILQIALEKTQELYEKILNDTSEVIGEVDDIKPNHKQAINTFFWGLEKQTDQYHHLSFLSEELRWTFERTDLCLLNFVHNNYFHKINRSYFETVKEEYCMEKTEPNGLKWRQTPVFTEVFPENFCLDRNLYLPSKYCYENGILEEPLTLGAHTECSDEYSLAEDTENLYQYLIECRYRQDKCKDTIALSRNATNLVDAALYLQYLSDTNLLDAETFLNIFENALAFIEIQGKHKRQLSYISSFMYFFLNSRATIPYMFEMKKNFIYLTLRPSSTDIFGWVLLKKSEDYVSLPLSLDNATESLSSNKDIEVAFFLNCEYLTNCTNNRTSVETFFIYSNDFTEDENYICNSRMVAFFNKDLESNDMQISVFLRTVDDSKEGFWHTFSLKFGELVVISITRPRNDICDSSNKLSIFRMYLARNSDEQEDVHFKNIIDLLSQLVVSVNIEIRELHYKHSPILHIITLTISILSLIGLTVIAISMFIIKNWCRKRFCTIQLALAAACENCFFLIDTKHFTYVGYIIFYYFMLAQFAWMMVVGYIQYTRFVKVFQTSELGIVKPMVVGWLVPLLIILGMVCSNLKCMTCNLCSKNGDIFTYFVMIPILVVIICNLTIYVTVMVNLLTSKFELSPEAKKARLRAAIVLPFMMGISWISILAILAPWSWVSMTGSYLFHIIAPSQGILLFVFLIILDKVTMMIWYNYFRCKIIENKN